MDRGASSLQMDHSEFVLQTRALVKAWSRAPSMLATVEGTEHAAPSIGSSPRGIHTSLDDVDGPSPNNNHHSQPETTQTNGGHISNNPCANANGLKVDGQVTLATSRVAPTDNPSVRANVFKTGHDHPRHPSHSSLPLTGAGTSANPPEELIMAKPVAVAPPKVSRDHLTISSPCSLVEHPSQPDERAPIAESSSRRLVEIHKRSRRDGKGKLPTSSSLQIVTKHHGASTISPTWVIGNRHPRRVQLVEHDPFVRMELNYLTEKISQEIDSLNNYQKQCDTVYESIMSHDWSAYLRPIQSLGVDTRSIDIRSVANILVDCITNYYKEKHNHHNRPNGS